jgi:hypothetical protein
MNVRGLCAAAWLVGMAAVGPACVKTLPLDDRPCACASGFRCCLASNRCVSPEEAARPSCQRPGPDSERADGGGDGKLDGTAATAIDTKSLADGAVVPDVTPGIDAALPADTMLPIDMAPPPPPDMATPPPPDMALPPPDMAPPPPDMAMPVDMMLPPDMMVVPRDCTTAARRCLPDGRTPQHCNDDGQWVTQLICELTCQQGTCTACTPSARRCYLGAEPQLCSAAGQWDTQAQCTGGDGCSGGLCLCGQNCDRGTLLDAPAGVVDLAAGGEVLWYHDGQKLWRVNLSTGQATEPHAMSVSAGHKPVGGLAADAQGNVFWCRQDAEATGSEVMRSGATFLAEPCRDLQLGEGHLYVDSGGRVSRFPLTGSGGNQVGGGALTAFAAGDQYVFLGFRARIFSQLYRNTLTGSGVQQMVWEQTMPGDPIYSVAVDAEHVYFAPGKVLLRLPVGGGQAAIAQQEDRDIDHIVLSDTHLYWTTVEFTEAGECRAAEVYRRSKIAPGPPHRLIRDEGRCPTALILHGDGLYLGTSRAANGLAPGRIVRLAR